MIKTYNGVKAFTLMELMVTITIMMLLSWAIYLNFAYSQTRMNLKLTAKDVSQSLYNARNMAINWLDSSSWNVSVWVYFDNSNDKNNKISFFTYPYDLDINSEDLLETSSKKLLKEIDFYKIIKLNDVGSKDKFLFFFQAITWSWSYYYRDDTPWKKSFVGDSIDIKISINQSESSNSIKEIKYITSTNIIDY